MYNSANISLMYVVALMITIFVLIVLNSFSQFCFNKETELENLKKSLDKHEKMEIKKLKESKKYHDRMTLIMENLDEL